MSRKHGKREPTLGPNSIRAWRLHRGLTLEQLAARIESTPATISRVERRVRPYSQGLIEALADALNCEPQDLVRGAPPSQADIDLWEVVKGLDQDKKRQATRLLRVLTEEAA